MQQLIRERGKDQVINVEQRASLYQTINQLLRAGLISPWGTDREEGFPERTIYKLTAKGKSTAIEWMREMLSTPEPEFADFPAAVSLLPLLTPADAVQQFELRQIKLTEQISSLDRELKEQSAYLPRLFMLETEYLRSVMQAELKWVRSIIADLQSGKLQWHQEWMKPEVLPELPDTATTSTKNKNRKKRK
jgi:DNA-binding PadR family transcriptional regulator